MLICRVYSLTILNCAASIIHHLVSKDETSFVQIPEITELNSYQYRVSKYVSVKNITVLTSKENVFLELVPERLFDSFSIYP